MQQNSKKRSRSAERNGQPEGDSLPSEDPRGAKAHKVQSYQESLPVSNPSLSLPRVPEESDGEMEDDSEELKQAKLLSLSLNSSPPAVGDSNLSSSTSSSSSLPPAGTGIATNTAMIITAEQQRMLVLQLPISNLFQLARMGEVAAFKTALTSLFSQNMDLRVGIMGVLTAEGANFLMLAVMSGKRDMVDAVLDNFKMALAGESEAKQLAVWTNFKLPGKWDALSLATANKEIDPEIVRLLLSKGLANPNDELGATHNPVHCPVLNLAAAKGSLAVVTILVEHKADANSLDFEGQTPLVRAACGKRWDIASYLLDAPGIDLEKALYDPTALKQTTTFCYALRMGDDTGDYELFIKKFVSKKTAPPTDEEWKIAEEVDAQFSQRKFSTVLLLTHKFGLKPSQSLSTSHYYFPLATQVLAEQKEGKQEASQASSEKNKIAVFALREVKGDGSCGFAVQLNTNREIFCSAFEVYYARLLSASEAKTEQSETARKKLQDLRLVLREDLRYLLDWELSVNSNPEIIKQRYSRMYRTVYSKRNQPGQPVEEKFSELIDCFIQCKTSDTWETFNTLCQQDKLLLDYLTLFRYEGEDFRQWLSRPLLEYFAQNAEFIVEDRSAVPHYVIWQEQTGSQQLKLQHPTPEVLAIQMEKKLVMHHIVYRPAKMHFDNLQFIGFVESLQSELSSRSSSSTSFSSLGSSSSASNVVPLASMSFDEQMRQAMHASLAGAELQVEAKKAVKESNVDDVKESSSSSPALFSVVGSVLKKEIFKAVSNGEIRKFNIWLNYIDERKLPLLEIMNWRLEDGTTLLMASTGSRKPAMVQLVLETFKVTNHNHLQTLNEWVRQRNKSGDDALLQLTMQDHPNLKLATHLLDAGADPNSRNARGEPLLFVAAQRGHLELVKLLVTRGANVNAVDVVNQNTALMVATQNDKWSVVAYFLGLGARIDVDRPNKLGETALQFAIMRRANKDIIRQFIAGKKSACTTLEKEAATVAGHFYLQLLEGTMGQILMSDDEKSEGEGDSDTERVGSSSFSGKEEKQGPRPTSFVGISDALTDDDPRLLQLLAKSAAEEKGVVSTSSSSSSSPDSSSNSVPVLSSSSQSFLVSLSTGSSSSSSTQTTPASGSSLVPSSSLSNRK